MENIPWKSFSNSPLPCKGIKYMKEMWMVRDGFPKRNSGAKREQASFLGHYSFSQEMEKNANVLKWYEGRK